VPCVKSALDGNQTPAGSIVLINLNIVGEIMKSKPDARITLTMEPDGVFRMEIFDPRGKRVIFSDPNDPYKAPYAEMEKAIGQTVRIILENKKEGREKE